MKHKIRVFQVPADAPASTPVPQPDQYIEASTTDQARRLAVAMFDEQRRPLRSLSFHADGGLVAYVLPPLPESKVEPDKKTKRRRRRRPGARL